jgi:hypothetical protein
LEFLRQTAASRPTGRLFLWAGRYAVHRTVFPICGKIMIQSVSYADVVRLHRTDAVCVGLRAGLPLLCFLVPESENTRHRADVPLSWCESAQANLPPEVRVRCVVRERAVRGPVVGQLPQPAMQRIHAMIARERTSQTVEGGWPHRTTPHNKASTHACMQKNTSSRHGTARTGYYA